MHLLLQHMEVEVNTLVTFKKNCRCCKSVNLSMVLDLQQQPLANSYCDKKTELEKFPLELMLCKNCYHMQLSVVIAPDLLFKNYLYVSGTSKTLHDYFKIFSNFSINRYLKLNDEFPKNIIDIACNDGSQLNKFKDDGLETFGVDPAQNLFSLSSANHNVFCGYFQNFESDLKFDILVAQNVFAHVDDIDLFLEKAKSMMHEKSILMIQTSQSDMIKNNEFDTIYHEHLSFFNSYSMKVAVERNGLKLNNVHKMDIHGTSYLFEISKNEKDGNFSDVLSNEIKEGYFIEDTYINYARKSIDCVNFLKEKLYNHKKNGYLIVGYGAAAKGNTLLNFGKIEMDFILDDNKLKHKMFTPGMNIQIESPEKLNEINEKEKICFVPLAWNFYNEIKSKIKLLRPNSKDKIIKFFPKTMEELL